MKAYWIAVAVAVGTAIGLVIGRPEPPVAQQPEERTAHRVQAVEPPPAPPEQRVDFQDPLHEEFLREPRDDAWALLREAELDDAMAGEVGAGNFKRERVECRASICQVQLSARGDQVELLRKWFDERNSPQAFAPGQPLVIRGASFSGNGSQATARLTYVRPQRVFPPQSLN